MPSICLNLPEAAADLQSQPRSDSSAKEKIDQYTREDAGYETPGLEALHSRLYRPGGHKHPGPWALV